MSSNNSSTGIMMVGLVAVAAGIGWYVLKNKTGATAKYEVGHILFKEGVGTFYIIDIGTWYVVSSVLEYKLSDYVTGAISYQPVLSVDNDPLWFDMGTQIA